MLVFSTVQSIQSFLNTKYNNKKIGFVPTMGALHKGHLSLVNRSSVENDITVVSIFVNPLQFNNKSDLLKYPRTPDTDLQKLRQTDCDVVFIPGYDDIYHGKINEHYDFGHLEQVMEGVARKGHFNGVAIVVKRLFDIIKPHRAYFGEKDYQQLLIIKSLVVKENLPVEIIPVEIVREPNGLAMSSRNELLTPKARGEAGVIYEVLLKTRELFNKVSITEIKEYVKQQFNKKENFTLEYFEIADGHTLRIVTEKAPLQNVRAFIVVYVENVRLIDNISLT